MKAGIRNVLVTRPGVRLSNTPAPRTPASAPSAPAAPQAMARIRSTGTPWSSAANGSSAVARSATPGELRKKAASARATPASTARITTVCHSTMMSMPGSVNPPLIGPGEAPGPGLEHVDLDRGEQQGDAGRGHERGDRRDLAERADDGGVQDDAEQRTHDDGHQRGREEQAPIGGDLAG